MNPICKVFIYIISASFITTISFITIFSKQRFIYWKKLGLDSVSASFPFGTTKDLLLGKITFGEQLKLFYDIFKTQKLKHRGAYLGPSRLYIPTDIDLSKTYYKEILNIL